MSFIVGSLSMTFVVETFPKMFSLEMEITLYIKKGIGARINFAKGSTQYFWKKFWNLKHCIDIYNFTRKASCADNNTSKKNN